VNGHAKARIPAEEQGEGDHRQGKHQDIKEEATPFPSTMSFQASGVKARSSRSLTEAGGEGPMVIWQTRRAAQNHPIRSSSGVG
jgi:hypothetical protein